MGEVYHNTKLAFLPDRIIAKGYPVNIIMMSWEKPMMKAHADIVCHNQGDVLEIGFGMGISANEIQALKPKSHTIIESHPEIYKRLEDWSKDKPNVTIIKSEWYLCRNQLSLYDGIFYDTLHDQHQNQMRNILPNLLKPNGRLTFFNTYPEARNQFRLPATYEKIEVSPPSDCSYYNATDYYTPTVVNN